jgi:hypothetical protein
LRSIGAIGWKLNPIVSTTHWPDVNEVAEVSVPWPGWQGSHVLPPEHAAVGLNRCRHMSWAHHWGLVPHAAAAHGSPLVHPVKVDTHTEHDISGFSETLPSFDASHSADWRIPSFRDAEPNRPQLSWFVHPLMAASVPTRAAFLIAVS